MTPLVWLFLSLFRDLCQSSPFFLFFLSTSCLERPVNLERPHRCPSVRDGDLVAPDAEDGLDRQEYLAIVPELRDHSVASETKILEF